MIFSFYLGNHGHFGLKGMADLLHPIYQGIIEAGHHVMGFGLHLHPAPIVNVVVEYFPEDSFVDDLLRVKSDSPDKFLFGLLCTEDLQDELVMSDPFAPRRRENLLRVLGHADFVWTLLPQKTLVERYCGAEKIALLEYGFSERLLNPRAISDPALRDLDAIMYGNATDYRRPVVEDLRRRGFQCFVSERHVLPDFVTSDLIRRSKALIELRRGPGVRFPSPTRIVKGLHSGAVVVAEELPQSEISSLYRYTVTSDYAGLADRCEQIIRSGIYVDLGLAALARFRAETSMAGNVKRAMQLPFFTRLAQAYAR